jgi:hypothetical protein
MNAVRAGQSSGIGASVHRPRFVDITALTVTAVVLSAHRLMMNEAPM